MLYFFSECKKCDECDCKENENESCDEKNGKCVCRCKDGFKEDCEECKEGYWMSSSGEFNSTTVVPHMVSALE